MSRRIDKQAAAGYAVWSTIVDDYVLIDCTLAQAVESCVEPVTARAREDFRNQALKNHPADQDRIEQLRTER